MKKKSQLVTVTLELEVFNILINAGYEQARVEAGRSQAPFLIEAEDTKQSKAADALRHALEQEG